MLSVIRIRTLGPVLLQVDDGDPPTQLQWRKNLALLLYLARSPEGTRTRDHLTGLLWGDKPDSAARHSLRESIRIIRKAVGEDQLSTEHDRVRLAPGTVEIDVDEFDRRVKEGDIEGAADLLRGEFLEGFSVPDASGFEDWLILERTHWHRRGAEVLTELAERRANHGRLREALEQADRALVLETSLERAIRVAMRAAALLGDRAGALNRFVGHRERLAGLGAVPERETSALADRVREERSWHLSDDVPSVDAGGAELRRAPLIGRDGELEQALGVWRLVTAKRTAGLLVIDGPAGVGKTRLAEELLGRARLDGGSIATVRSVEGDKGSPSNVVLGLARGGLLEAPGLSAAPREALAAFSPHVPAWADRFGQQASDMSLDGAFSAVISAVAEECPTLLFVDDAHWADGESLHALAALVRDHHALPLLLAYTVDSSHTRDEIDQIRARIERDLHGRAITLKHLDRGALSELARWAVPLFGSEDIDRLTRRVAEDSAGLPLLAVELLHAVALGLDLGAIDGAWPKPLQTLDQTLPGDLPDAVVAAIRIGYRRLSTNARTALAAISVLGDRVSPTHIGLATDLTGDPLNAALDELEWQRWVTAEPRGYACVARIVRDVLARDMVTDGQRMRMREAIERTG